MTNATHENLEDLTNAELLGIYNGLRPDAPLKAWKGKKDVLIDRIGAARAEALTEALTEAPEQTAAAPATEKPDAPDVVTSDVTGEAEVPHRTVRAAALELLCHVAYYENRNEKPDPLANAFKATGDVANARSVGLPYDEIIRRIQDEFPDCQTSVACLRWYAVKVRAEEFGYEGLRLPQRRPRVKPVKKD